VKSYFEAALKVVRKTSPIYLESDFCGDDMLLPASAWDDGYVADTVIVVSAIYSPSASFLARSWNCAYDTKTGRPIVAIIQYNTAKLPMDNKDVTFEVELSTTLHEITHGLGFSRSFYKRYINPDTLEPLTGHVFNKTVNGVDTMVLDVPPLTQRLRAHFNCSTLEGAYLENQGGSGSFGAHFERRVFFNEYMTASRLKDRRISEFTLALLEGSGWYKPNYLYAEPMTYGKNAGCAFLDTECINRETLEPNFKEFCSPLKTEGIYWTKRGTGYCGSSKNYIDEDLIKAFDYWGDKTVVDDDFADNCPQWRMWNNYDCEDVGSSSSAMLDEYEYFGVGGKALMGTLSLGYDPYSRPQGYCFKTQCVKKDNGNYDLKVFFSGDEETSVTCDSKRILNSMGFDFDHEMVGDLHCPDPNEFCEQVLSEGFCKTHCFNNGFCNDNECKCDEGWTSYNCARKEMVDQCESCAYSDSLRTTCYGDDCVCNPSNTTCQCLLGLKTGRECLKLDDGKTDNGNTDGKSDTGNTDGKSDTDGKKDNDNGNNTPPTPSNPDNTSTDTQPNPYRESQIIYLIVCGILVVIIIGVVLSMRKKEITPLNDSLSRPMMSGQSDQVVL